MSLDLFMGPTFLKFALELPVRQVLPLKRVDRCGSG